METKKLGFVIIGISILLGFVMYSYSHQLNQQSTQNACNPSKQCQEVQSALGLTNIFVGIIVSLFSLGFYIIFFNRNDNATAVLQKIEEEKTKQLVQDKFQILLRAFDENEQRVLQAIQHQQGITQNTLRLKANLSKSKLSVILQDLEKKQIVKRSAKGKTYALFLTEEF